MDIQIFAKELYKALSMAEIDSIDPRRLYEIAEWGESRHESRDGLGNVLNPLSKEAEELARVLTTVFAWLEFTDRI